MGSHEMSAMLKTSVSILLIVHLAVLFGAPVRDEEAFSDENWLELSSSTSETTATPSKTGKATGAEKAQGKTTDSDEDDDEVYVEEGMIAKIKEEMKKEVGQMVNLQEVTKKKNLLQLSSSTPKTTATPSKTGKASGAAKAQGKTTANSDEKDVEE